MPISEQTNVNSRTGDPGIRDANAGTAAAQIFRDEWQVYRKMVDNNYLFHQEAYEALHRVLVEETNGPFRFLDIACGDAGMTARALGGTRVAHYRGMDLSPPALDLAREALSTLPCSVTLDQCDFVDALRGGIDSYDVVWIGLSLHHFLAGEKFDLMRRIRRVVGDTGIFLIYENAGPDDETRDAWMARWDLQRPAWPAYTQAEWDRMSDHVHSNDYPETDAMWRVLGRAAGFGRIRQIYATPTDLFRLYSLRA